MREHPMLFNQQMVRAVLEGRKTETRRLVKLPPRTAMKLLPFEPGDVIWVRETWALEDLAEDAERVVWQADRCAAWRSALADRFYVAHDYKPARWTPSIHMPRWAARTFLRVTSCREERLQDITAPAVFAEGLQPPLTAGFHVDIDGYLWDAGAAHVVREFARFWDTFNKGAGVWAANPLVTVTTFELSP